MAIDSDKKTGKGAYKIINAHMEDWVTAKKTRVFKAVGKNALDKVEQSWDTFIQNFWNTMSELITSVYFLHIPSIFATCFLVYANESSQWYHCPGLQDHRHRG